MTRITGREGAKVGVSILQRWRYRHSSDLRDNLYGLISLFRRSNLSSTTYNYIVSESKVIIDLTLDLLRLAGSLLPLVS